TASTMLNLDEFGEKYNKAMKNNEPINSDEFTSDELAYLFEKRNKIFQWTAPNPVMPSGQLTAIGNQAYQIGRRLFYKDKEYEDADGKIKEGMYFYISDT